MNIVILVTHLLGIGHLTRAATLARAFARAGHATTLISGGRAAPHVAFDGVDLVQLPPVWVKGTDFRALYEVDGTLAIEGYLAQRQATLVEAITRVRPDVLITELFPFGRQQLAAEFIAGIDAARAINPDLLMFTSIRDVLNPDAAPRKVQRTLQQFDAYFDGVLVHGDPAVVPLDASFNVTPALARRVHYTGYVHEAAPVHGQVKPSGEIVVSAGGSSSGVPLLQAALAATELDPARRWRLLVGHGVPNADFAALQAAAGPNATVERARPDFAELLAGAACSISQFGYNTALDLAAAGVPAVIVPFDDGNEKEQGLRAERFAGLGMVTVVPASQVSGATLLDAVQRAMALPRGEVILRMDGAAQSVAIIAAACAEQQAVKAAWARLNAALDQADRPVRIWWRDDDAVAATPALDRLLNTAAEHHVPVALAVIPERLEVTLAERLRSENLVSVLVHGIAHRNNAPAPAKKQELVAADIATLTGLKAGRVALAEAFGTQALPVLVPPWNRIAPEVLAVLPALGFAGWSGYDGSAELIDQYTAKPTHLDPIAWKQGGGLVPLAPFIDRAAQLIRMQARRDDAAPIGFLTHHLVHDEPIWRFTEAFVARLAKHPAVKFCSARDVFNLT